MKLLDSPVALAGLARRWSVPVLVALVVGAATVTLYQTLYERESLFISVLVEAEAGRLKGEAAEQIGQRIEAIRDLARRWEREPAPTEEAWQQDAARLLARDIQFRAVEWVDPSLTTRWFAPEFARVAGGTLDSTDDGLRLQALRVIEDLPGATLSGSYLLADGHRQALICAPMFAQGRGAGFIVGVVRLRDLFDTIFKQGLSEGYTVAVYEDPFLIYGASWLRGGGEAVWARDNDLAFATHSLRIQVWPSADMYSDMRTVGLRLVLVLGWVLAVALAILIERMQTWRGRALRAEAAGHPAATPAPLADPIPADPGFTPEPPAGEPLPPGGPVSS
jgi:sensor domain CHASE-containing protein